MRTLELPTKPVELLEADEGAAEGEEGLMDVGAALAADGQPTEPVEPSQRALDGPAVAAEPFSAVNAVAGDTPAPAGCVAEAIIIAFVAVQLGGGSRSQRTMP